jgi:hypothetical protein
VCGDREALEGEKNEIGMKIEIHTSNHFFLVSVLGFSLLGTYSDIRFDNNLHLCVSSYRTHFCLSTEMDVDPPYAPPDPLQAPTQVPSNH